jgi:DNA repair protein RecN (Recombination protein N)
MLTPNYYLNVLIYLCSSNIITLIKRLRIQNYAIIRDVEIDFSPHLIVITGETGAGKSILLGALNLVLGHRADTKAIGNPADKCIVEAEFVLGSEDLKPFFELHDLDFDDDLILRREISPQGKSRAFINDSPVTLDILQSISAALIDIHQQFDTLDIYQVSTQLKMIDALAGNKTILKSYQLGFKIYSEQLKLLKELRDSLMRQQQEEEFIKFQFNELDEVNLIPGELDQLESEQKELAHAGDLRTIAETLSNGINEDDQSVINQLNDLERKLLPLSGYHAGMRNISERLSALIAELEDLAAESKVIGEKIDLDPARLSEIDLRLSSLYRLMQKHKVKHTDQLIDLKNTFQSKLISSDELLLHIHKLEKEQLLQQQELNSLAEELHINRKKAIPGFIQDIYKLLIPLGMEQTRIQILLKPSDTFHFTGKDEMEFLLATNKGGSFLPIKNIASGGELARFNLVTKSLVARAIPLPTLIFDEIDIGISGDVALRMGQILKDLAQDHQVICITHSPQIASKGDIHYYVFKDDTTDRTLAQVKKLNKSERIQSIAAMLSSNPPSAAAMKNAKELIEI